MVTTSISVTENNTERSDDVDILLMPTDATRYVTASIFTCTTGTSRGFGSNVVTLSKKIIKICKKKFANKL